MHKFSFTVDIVTDSPSSVNVDTVRESLLDAVDGVGSVAAVHRQVKTETMKEQGYKVWSKRVAGISLATPKAPKAPKPQAETVEA